jgi:predicted Zn finger-like uncharacterized protein
VKFLCEQCKAKYQIADEKAAGKTVRMKCRKCGHLIEVRAAVTETSVSSVPPAPGRQGAPTPANRPRNPSLAGIDVSALKAPIRGRPAPFAAGVAARTPPKPDQPPGALEGAFKSAVQYDSTSTGLPRRGPQTDEEVSAPIDMSDLSPSDEWYVAINGVPVGPIRVAEVRRKAALGAVTEDALVWQEGLDEWRPLRMFPELAASVREAMSRLSRPPPGEARSSVPPPPPRGMGGRASLPGMGLPRAAPLPPRAPPSLSARSNVVAITSRLATAEKLDELPLLAQPPAMSTSVVSDPFASIPMAAAATAPSAFTAASTFSSLPPPAKKSTPWMALAMIASAIAFGVTTAVVIFARPAPQQAPATGVAVPGASAAARPIPSAVASPLGAPEIAEPAPNQPLAPFRGPTAAAAPKPITATATATGRSLDLHSLTQNGPAITPSEEQANDGPKAPGQCFSEGQVQQVIGLHQVAIRRACWERNPTTKPTVNVGVSMTIGPEGGAQNVVATGDEPSVSKCIENDVRGWRFPAMGCSQKTGFSFKFVRQ